MSKRSDVSSTTASRALETYTLATPLAFALVLALLSVGALSLWSLPMVAVGLLAVLALVGPALVFLDARAIQDADVDWSPNPALYALGCLVFPYVVVLHYLYVRYEHVPGRSASRYWLYGVPLVIAATAGTFAASYLGLSLPLSLTLVTGFVFPVAIYQDAKRLRATGASWRPNPATQFTIAWFAGVLPLFQPVYAGYYLYRRRTAA